MQRRVKLPCMGYMRLLTPRSVVDQFMVIPAVTVSDCLFRGVWGFCVNVRILLQLFSLVSPSAWCLLIVTDGCTSSDWWPGPMLVCVHLGDICIVMGSSLIFLVFFVYVLIRKSWSYLFYHNTRSWHMEGNPSRLNSCWGVGAPLVVHFVQRQLCKRLQGQADKAAWCLASSGGLLMVPRGGYMLLGACATISTY